MLFQIIQSIKKDSFTSSKDIFLNLTELFELNLGWMLMLVKMIKCEEFHCITFRKMRLLNTSTTGYILLLYIKEMANYVYIKVCKHFIYSLSYFNSFLSKRFQGNFYYILHTLKNREKNPFWWWKYTSCSW